METETEKKKAGGVLFPVGTQAIVKKTGEVVTIERVYLRAVPRYGAGDYVYKGYELAPA